MRRLTSLMLFAVVLTAGPGEAQAGDFVFTVGRDIGAVDFTGARAVTNVGTRLGFQTGQWQVFGTADFARYRISTEYASPDFTDTERTGALYTVGAGGRFFFSKPEASQAIPYVVAAGFAVIPQIGQEKLTETDSSARTGGAMAGFGAEYFFDDVFSVGGELGVSGVFGYLQQDTTTWQGNILQAYSGVQLNFYLF